MTPDLAHSTTSDPALPATASTRPSVVRVLRLAVPLVLVANLAVFAIGHLTTVSFAIQTLTASKPETVTLVPVLAMSTLPLLAAGLVLRALRRWAPRSWRVLAWLGLAVGVVSMPVFAQAGSGTKVALAAMHLLTGVIFWALTRREARR